MSAATFAPCPWWYHCSTFEHGKEVWWVVSPEGQGTRVRNKREALRVLRTNNRARRAKEGQA